MDRDNGDLPLDLGVPNFRKTQLIQDFHPECSGSKKIRIQIHILEKQLFQKLPSGHVVEPGHVCCWFQVLDVLVGLSENWV